MDDKILHGVEVPAPPLAEVMERIADKPSHFALGDIAYWAGEAAAVLRGRMSVSVTVDR